MGLMLATYQYFVSKRSNTGTASKEELLLQAEVNCLKQYQEFATTMNEKLKDTTALYTSLKGNGSNNANYTCKGSDVINSYKYCIDAADNPSIVSCNTSIGSPNPVAKFHCVATTRYKILNQKNIYLKSHIIKDGVSVIYVEGKGKTAVNKINGKPVIIGEDTNKDKNIINLPIGMINCVDISKINEVNKFSNVNCKAGQTSVSKNGKLVCQDVAENSFCTAHEDLVSNISGRQNCTQVSVIENKYCCAKLNPTNLCKNGESVAIWDSYSRFYKCSDGTEYCQNKKGFIDVKNTKGKFIETIVVNDAWTVKYNKEQKSFSCMVKPELYVSACQAKQTKDNKYVKVEGIENKESEPSVVKGEKVKEEKRTGANSYQHPVCVLAYKQEFNAVENCSPCETVEFDSLNNKWYCRGIKGCSELNPSIIAQLKGESERNLKGKATGNYVNEKGLKSCFSNCSSEQIGMMKQGTFNTPTWGVTYNKDTRMWDCFNCTNDNYNNVCNMTTMSYDHSCGIQEQLSFKNCNNSEEGKCVPKVCSSIYQTLIDGQCFSKWCPKSKLPYNVEIGKIKDPCCPASSSWMVFNEKLNCVYCIRPPAVKIDNMGGK